MIKIYKFLNFLFVLIRLTTSLIPKIVKITTAKIKLSKSDLGTDFAVVNI